MSNTLVPESLSQYFIKATPTSWGALPLNQTYYFVSSSLDAYLTELELMATEPNNHPTTHASMVVLKDWIGDVTLSELQNRLTTLETNYAELQVTRPEAAIRQTVATSMRLADLQNLGVRLYGSGTELGLYLS
jgi:hypothetical protein|nr:MAG: hypothetical protein [Bacteriophage sp.]